MMGKEKRKYLVVLEDGSYFCFFRKLNGRNAIITSERLIDAKTFDTEIKANRAKRRIARKAKNGRPITYKEALKQIKVSKVPRR